MFLGYNTNGFAFHDPLQAVELLAEIGYQGVAMTLDHGTLNPFDKGLEKQISRMREQFARFSMRCFVETGARFLLDPRVKHEPTLMSADKDGRRRRIDFLRRAVDVAVQLGADGVSLWSGVLREPLPADAARRRLADGLREVVDYAGERAMTVAFEPEPGMFVARMDDFAALLELMGEPNFRLTLDVGHLHCLGELPVARVIRECSAHLANVHIEDMRAGVHDHRMFGEGEMDFPPILAALADVGYRGGVYVELSRHSHEAPTAALRAFEFLKPMLKSTDSARRDA